MVFKSANQDACFSYETSDGQKREEYGQIIRPEGKEEFLFVTGSYSYIGPDGVTYKTEYVADDTGYHPVGDHLTAPEIISPTTVTEIIPPPVALPPSAINSLLG